ncbi:hypothetical protein LOAG_17255 [Loa loa]|nr:hypothetical protein LOAG_17255 [Loa loa]EJD75633.1 hypothetical protein LOAG_17255 [Loa loa]
MTGMVSAVFQSPWAPDMIDALQFQYKGPLNVCIKQPICLKHDLENSVVESPKAEDHIVFDDNLNEVYEIGSEVEIMFDQRNT